MRDMPHDDEGQPTTEMAFLQPLFDRLAAHGRRTTGRPFVTLSYAQSVDGSIAVRPSRPFALSSEKSLNMTHLLRSRHDALLVGINTVLVDDPRLTVRRCAGNHPQPVVLDSTLRFPTGAKLLTHPDKRTLLFTTASAPAKGISRLEGKGASIQVLPSDKAGRVDLNAVLRALAESGIRHLMVEGGASIINSFLQSGLVDYCVITMVPRLIGGLKAVDHLCTMGDGPPLSIVNCLYHPLDGDLIIHGEVGKV